MGPVSDTEGRLEAKEEIEFSNPVEKWGVKTRHSESWGWGMNGRGRAGRIKRLLPDDTGHPSSLSIFPSVSVVWQDMSQGGGGRCQWCSRNGCRGRCESRTTRSSRDRGTGSTRSSMTCYARRSSIGKWKRSARRTSNPITRRGASRSRRGCISGCT